MNKMANKINALLLKAESTEFPEEAEALTAKAMQLMSQYAIDEALLEATKTEKDPREKVETRIARVPKPYSMERMVILQQVAKAMGGYMYYYPQARDGMKTALNSKDHSTKVGLIGFPSDLDRIWQMFESLIRQEANARKYEIEGCYFEGQGQKKIWNKSFIRAFAYRIGSRLKEIMQEGIDSQANSSSVALVFKGREQAVNEAVAAAGLGKGKSSQRQTSFAGAAAGRAAGNRASLSHELEG